MCWGRTKRGWCVHICPLLAGNTGALHESPGRAAALVMTRLLIQPAAKWWKSLRCQALSRQAGAVASTKASCERGCDVLCSWLLGVPRLSLRRLALCHPLRLSLLPLERTFINRGWRRSDPLSGRLSTLAPVAGGREGWAEAALGSLKRGVGGSRKMANKVPFCEMWHYTGNTEAAEGEPLGKVNVKTEKH